MATRKSAPVTVDKNAHITEFLTQFVTLKHPPRYAVMLNGPWGIGKTYLVDAFLKGRPVETESHVRVSLYGLSSTAEIDAALLRSIHPFLASKGVEAATRLAKTVAKAFKVDTDFKVTEFLTKFKAAVYVFDDLERVNMSINEVMGYINEFVEHDGSKVIIVANEKEIEEGKEGALYLKAREKLIGKTFEIQSAFDEALTHFLSLVDATDAAAVLTENRDEISLIYGQSHLNNLRILQQTIWDFERVVKALTIKQRGHKKAMKALLQLFFALNFDVRSGRLTALELAGRETRMISGLMDGGKQRPNPVGLAATSSRYPEVNILDTILSDELLIELLIKGRVQAESLRQSLDRSNYLVNPNKEPPWRVLWHWFEREEKDVENAKEAVIKQLAAGSITKSGELMHLFGLQLFLSDNQIIEATRQSVVTNAKQYIDDLLASDKLEPLNYGDGDPLRLDGYGGLGIHEYQTPEHQEIRAYFDAQRKRAAQKQYPSQAEKLLLLMERNVDLFYDQICSSVSSAGSYVRTPILSVVDPTIFVSRLLKLSAANQRIVFQALNGRYEHGSLRTDLMLEAAWLARVSEEIERRAQELPALTKLRILRNRDWTILRVLKSE